MGHLSWMWLLLAACAGPPPDLLAEMRTAAPDDPRLVQCLLPRLDVPGGVRDAAWAAAKARGHTFRSRRAYEDALDIAITRWVVTEEAPGSRGEANRMLCIAGRGTRPQQVAAALDAAPHDGDLLRRLLLAETGEVDRPATLEGRILRLYEPCWRDRGGTARRGEDGPGSPSILAGRSRTPPQPEWAAPLTAVSILGDMEGFFRAGRPAWGGLESVHTARIGDVTIVLLGGAARCQLADDAPASDVMAFRAEDGDRWLRRVSFQPTGDVEEGLPRGLRVEGDALVVEGSRGETRYWLQPADRGCIPDSGPAWVLGRSAPGEDHPRRR